MNKIYRKLWSTARQCWVVASELTTARGKAAPATRVGASPILLAALAGALVLPDAQASHFLGCDTSAGGQLVRCAPFAGHTDGVNYADAANGSRNYMGFGAGNYTDGSYSTSFGNSSYAKGDYVAVFGHGARTTDGYSAVFGARALGDGLGTSAFGNDAKARGKNSLAFGSGAQTADGGGEDRIAIGGDAHAGNSGYTGAISIGGRARSAYDGVSLGFQANAQAAGAVALGRGAQAQQTGSVALGRDSIATQTDTVSVGNATKKRRIVNVADGAVNSSSYDAVNGRTLQREKDALNASIGTVRTAASTAKTAADNARSIADQALARANTQGYTVATGSPVTEANKATATGNVSVALGHSARAEGAAAAAFGNGSKALGNNAIAIGSVAEASGTNAMAIGGNSKATHNNAVALGERSVTTAADQVSVGNATLKRSIVNVKDGLLAAGSSEAVTGNQLHATNTQVNAVKARLDAAAVALGSAAAAEGGGASASAALGSGAKAYNSNGIALGADARANVDAAGNKSTGTGGVALGANSRSGNGAVAAGLRASAVGDRGVAMGNDAKAEGAQSTAVGYQASASNGQAAAFGRGAEASGLYALSVGSLSKASAQGAVALGNGANASHSGSVALGQGSVTTGTNQVSVGKAGGERKIVNVGDGALNAASTDAVTGRQLNTTNTNVTTAQNTAAAAQTAAGTAQTTANTAVAKADALGGLVSQVSATGNVRLGGENTGTTLDMRNKSNANRKLSGVADATLNGTSTEAVTGRQLNTTNTNVTAAQNTATAAQTAAGTAQTTANSAVAKADALGGLVSQVSGSGNVRLGSENTGNVVDVANKNGGKRRVYNIADGVVSRGSTDAVTGSQLFATNELVRVQGEALTAHDGRIADNRSELQKLRGEFDSFDPELDGVVKFDADGHVDVAGGKVKSVAAGDISSAASTDAVNGGQLFATNERIESLELGRSFVNVSHDASSEAAEAGRFAVAIGDGARASLASEGGTAIGSFTSADGRDSVALGRGANVGPSADQGFALGVGSNVYASNGVALGAYARVEASADSAVALGSGSIADQSGTVSLGSKSFTRRLVNLGRGKDLTDGVTIAQLNESLLSLGGGAAVDANGNVIAPTYNIQGGIQRTVGEALDALDSAVVAGDARVDRVENQLRSVFQEGPSVRADGLGQLNLSGANGMVLSNLADGRVAAGSRDAVTGNQLFDVKQDIEKNRAGLEDLRAGSSGNPLFDSMSTARGGVIDFGGSRLTGVADGSLSSGSQDVVNGGQLFATNVRIDELQERSKFFVAKGSSGASASAGQDSVAIGNSSRAGTSANGGATAVGAYSSALAEGSVAIGRGSFVSMGAENGFSLGTGANVYAKNGLSIGRLSEVESTAYGAVALGSESVASEAMVVSVGHQRMTRRIVNVGRGTSDNDATTVAQLRDSLAVLGGNIDANGNIINPTFNVQGGQQSTLNDALATLDSAVITGTQRVDRVESQLRSVFQDGPSVRSDGVNQLNLAGTNGMVLSNVANGYVGAGSRDAVNGGQLYSLQQQLNGRVDGLEQRLDGQPQAPQSRALTIASADAGAPAAVPAASPEPETPATPPPSAADNKVADNGAPPPPTPQADAPKPEAPTPQVDTAELEKMLARANEYSDGISREVDRRLDKMDKRFNRMAAMSSAQSAMAMNTAGLNTYNRLGAGVGYSEGESAMAVGYQRVLNDKGSATFSLNGAFTNSGERTVGVGVGIGW
ncbi:ESPR-type extended signal peptide-containing protein [Stenotrophomonas maltophilia]|uniref:ESPR-type extended signal peptide-containing protein n=1 Tax=Stenotrophomonas maltophilia TaxID=40324 RepID=UPI0039C2F190